MIRFKACVHCNGELYDREETYEGIPMKDVVCLQCGRFAPEAVLVSEPQMRSQNRKS